LIGFYQQGKAAAALAMLRSRLSVESRVLRDFRWRTVPARELVVDDVVRVRVGDIVPADIRLIDGHLSLDQSALTGESIASDVGPGDGAYSASTVTRGEATGVVTATGASTFYGQTSQLVQTASPPSQTEAVVFRVVKALVVLDVALVAALVAYALSVGTSLRDVLPFALIILIASVPVALPTTFTVAEAVGALELSKKGVLITRLSAVQESASMDVLCSDKTGTLTLNQLSLADAVAYPPTSRQELLGLAAAASDEAGQDAIDLAVLVEAPSLGWERLEFHPFDPSTKRTSAVLLGAGGSRFQVVKGMPGVVAGLCETVPASFDADVSRLSSTGARVLAVAAAHDGDGLRIVGLLALADRPRPNSAEVVASLRDLGVDVRMVTGDSAATAMAIAEQVGIDPSSVSAGVYPADKFELVKSLQESGHVVGMTGDGVNDAPALKNAVDVAKSSAGIVLTDPGLVDVVSAVRVSRMIHQRMLTWTLNKIIKTAQVAAFLTLSFFITRSFVITPFLIVLLLFANDFVTMSLAVDRARPSPHPDRWRVDALVAAALALAVVVLAESFLDLYLARSVFGLSLLQQQTLIFLMLVFTGQATVYVVRERGWFWSSRPGGWLLLATAFDVVVVTVLAVTGTWMTAVSLPLVLMVLGLAAAFMLIMDPVKVWVLGRLGLGRGLGLGLDGASVQKR
jgi:H+-transporting ATPase